jgi:hypothetical protein
VNPHFCKKPSFGTTNGSPSTSYDNLNRSSPSDGLVQNVFNGNPESNQNFSGKATCTNGNKLSVMNEIQLNNEQDYLKSQNQSQLELELLLKESIDILNETETKLHGEYRKKEEFMNLFRSAADVHATKELNLRLMIDILSSKILTSQSPKNFDEFNDPQDLTQTTHNAHKSPSPTASSNHLLLLQIYNELVKGVPVIMETFKENLQLKNCVDINERIDPKNFEQKENYCRIMVEI